MLNQFLFFLFTFIFVFIQGIVASLLHFAILLNLTAVLDLTTTVFHFLLGKTMIGIIGSITILSILC